MALGAGYSTTSTIRAIYGSVSFEKTSNLHAGLCGAKSARRGGSGARCCAASPLTMAFPQLVLKKWRNSCRAKRLTEQLLLANKHDLNEEAMIWPKEKSGEKSSRNLMNS
jgi:hypothetical protein